MSMTLPDIATVLVVEDEPDLSELVTMEFSIHGHRTYTALDGAKALDILREQPVDLVICDVRMPHMSGLELLDLLKEANPFRPAVVFISAYADIELRALYGRGAEGYFNKPFHLSALAERAEFLLAQRRAPWARQVETAGELTFVKVESGRDRAALSLGRGGCAVALPGPAAAHAGQRVRLSVPCPQLAGLRLDGLGTVRWICDGQSGTMEYGIEFETLQAPARERYLDWLALARPVAYIPERA